MSPAQIAVGQRAQLEITVVSTGGERAKIEFAPPPGMQVALISQQRSSSGSSSFSISFGTGSGSVRRQQAAARGGSASETRVYLLVPNQPGDFALDVAAVAGGQRVAAAPQPVLKVTGQALPPPPAVPAAPPGTQPPANTEEMFLYGTATPNEVFVGQPLTYALEIWDRKRQRFQYELKQRPSFKDFWSEEADRPRERRGRVGNRVYRVKPVMARLLVPQRAGELQISGGILEASPYGGFFFSGGPSETFEGKPVKVTVKPLPAKGQPPNFSAHNVGRYKIAIKADRTSMSQGDAFKLTVEIEGEGNIRLAEPSSWPAIKGLSRYDPEVEPPQVRTDGGRIRGRRRWTFLMIAEQAGTQVIPAHSISFFDPSTASYDTQTTPEIKIEVAPKAGYLAQDDADAQANQANASQDEDPLAPVTGGKALARVAPREDWLTAGKFDRLALGLVGVTGAAVLGQLAWQRYGPDDAARRRAEAQAWRDTQVAGLRAAVDGGDGFWGHAAELMQARALARLGPGFEGRTRAELAAALTESSLPQSCIDEWRSVLDRADAARFGAGSGVSDERASAMKVVLAALEDPQWGAWDA